VYTRVNPIPATTLSAKTKERASGFTPDFWKKGSFIIAQTKKANQKKNTIQLMASKIHKPPIYNNSDL
jgi:hypothetical protein